MTALVTKARTALALGLGNVAAAMAYRHSARLGLHPACRLQADPPVGPFFAARPGGPSVPTRRGADWDREGVLFSHLPLALGDDPPDWNADPIAGARVPEPEREWWRIADFDPRVGDIKKVWELSRMEWAPALAQRAAQGDSAALVRLERWLADWNRRCPPYRGPNWKCGQETSVRILHLAVAARILGHVRAPSAGLRDMIRVHLERVLPTVAYAQAQDNNHATTEAAGLFIGGSWLEAAGEPGAARFTRAGRALLSSATTRLIGADGSFSQYSVNYHRMVLDSLALAEWWRRELGVAPFAEPFAAKAGAATRWLHALVDPADGDVPNIGANDGARLVPLAPTGYRDHRPTVQLAAALFLDAAAFVPGPWDATLEWLGVTRPATALPPAGDRIADDAGFAVLRRGAARAVLRYPRYRFRPNHADALHVDLRVAGEDLLRDGGSYSYNTDPDTYSYFAGVASHNTVQFDGRDQMPRLSRFLYGDWLATESLDHPTGDGGAVAMAAAYRDRAGARHRRALRLATDGLQVDDRLDGRFARAVLRWRLAPRVWQLRTDADRVVVDDGQGTTLAVRVDAPLLRAELVQGWESRRYLESTALPVLEVEVGEPCAITTNLRWPT